MLEEGQRGFIATERPARLITGRVVGIVLFALLCVAVGLVALLAPPLLVGGILAGSTVAVLVALYPYFGLFAYYVSSVVQPDELFPTVEALHPTRLLLSVLLAAVIIHKKLRKESFLFWQERMTRQLLLFYLAIALSIPLSFWPGTSFRFLTDFLWTLVFYVVLINVLTTEWRLKGFIWLIMVVAGYEAISSAIAYFSGATVVAQGIERATSLIGTDPNTLAFNLMLVLPFFVYSVRWIESRRLRLLPIVFCAASALTIALTGSRAGIIGMAVTGVLLWITLPRKIVAAIVAVVIVVFGWFALSEQYQERYTSIFASEYDASTEGRIDAWKAGIGMFLHNPITGIGVDAFPYAYASGRYSETKAPLRPHSMYVQLISELGLFGTAAFGWMLWYMLRSNFRLRKRLKATGAGDHFFYWLSHSLTTSCGALFVTSLFAHSLFRSHWYLVCGLTVVVMRLALDNCSTSSADRSVELVKQDRFG